MVETPSESPLKAEISASSLLLDREMKQSESLQLRALLGDSQASWYPKFESEKMIIGEVIRDNATQTDISEVPCIKLLTAQADKLKEERDEILTTQETTWKTMEAAYSKNLSEQASVIYSRTNKQMDYIESLCKKRVVQARQSARQELNDAIQTIAAQYKSYYEGQLSDAIHQAETQKHKKKFAFSGDASEFETGQLREEISRLTLQNEELKSQLEEEAVLATQSLPVLAENSGQSGLNSAKEENKKLNVVVQEMMKNCAVLKEEIGLKADELAQALGRADVYQTQYATQAAANKELRDKCEKLEEEFVIEREKHRTDMLQQTRNVKTQMEEQFKVERIRSEEMADEQRKMASIEVAKRDTEIDALKKILRRLQAEEQKTKTEHARRQSPAASSAMTRSSPALIDASKRAPSRVFDEREEDQDEIKSLQIELAKTRKELESSNRNWESRFDVLRASLHEIKDESFLRRRLEHQPLAIHTTNYPSPANKRPLHECPHVLPPLKPALAAKSATPSAEQKPPSPAISEAFTSGSESENEEVEDAFKPVESHQIRV